MTHIFRRVVTITCALLLATFSVNVSGVMSLSAAAAANNGTLKVHEFGTPSGTESNDPKVCAFNFEGFGFGAGQDGYIVVESQPGGVSSLNPSPMPFGPTDANGYSETPYINNGGAYTLADGHYKVTLYGKDTGNPANPDLSDEKAKSKVFKVTCESEDTEVPTVAPTHNDACGTANDTYTIPTATGVDYQVLNQTVAAATYPGTGTVVITAVAQAGYALTGTTEWTYAFTNVACDTPLTPATPETPGKTDNCKANEDGYTIPTTTGVTYYVGGQVATAGFHPATGSVTITASANAGYTLTGDSEWTYIFTNNTCEPEPCTATTVQVIPLMNTPGNNNCPLGMGGGGQPQPQAPRIITTYLPAVPTELPQTGPSESNALTKLLVTALAGIVTYGVMFYLVNRRSLTKE